ncbi:MAG: helix-turn-helix domain-containing protein [Solirubrobacterales bacterium]
MPAQTTAPKRRGKTETGEPHPVDLHVGEKLRLMRTLRGYSQTELATRVGLTFQQVQKYESGANRISASRLWEIAEALDTPIGLFYDGLRAGAAPAAPTGLGESAMGRGNLQLIRYFEGIPDDTVREGVFELVKRLAKSVR